MILFYIVEITQSIEGLKLVAVQVGLVSVEQSKALNAGCNKHH